MTPQEKAKEIFIKCLESDILMDNISAKKCALIAVDEIIQMSDINKIVYSFYEGNCLTQYTEDFYWKKVKQEIEKL